MSTSPSQESPPEPATRIPFEWRLDEQPIIDLRMNGWPVRDQGAPGFPLGACAAFAATALHELARSRQPFVWLSELSLIASIGADFTGSVFLDDAFAALHQRGQLSGDDYSAFVTTHPDAPGLMWRKVRISTISRLPRNIEKEVGKGRAVLLGVQQMVSLSQPDQRGVVSVVKDDKPEGNVGQPVGHAVVVVGKVSIRNVEYFLVRNSWGEDWARGGYGFIDPTYVAQYGREAAIVEAIMG